MLSADLPEGSLGIEMAFFRLCDIIANMNRLAEQLDEQLRTLDPARVRYLESAVRAALEKVRQDTTWPAGYFEQTAGAFAGEELERPPQGQLPRRADW